MAELAVNRSIQFVSLDTHPANNALVLTYELLISVLESPSSSSSSSGRQRELAKRTKRDQILIGISALDALQEQDLRDGKLAVDLEQLSAEIVQRCPLLQSGNHNHLEDIQLHLLYLINRRQSQLLSAAREQPTRQPSAVSASRLRSAQSRLMSAGSVRSNRQVTSDFNQMSVAQDVYAFLRSRETTGAELWHFERDAFISQLDEHLSEVEDPIWRLNANKEIHIRQLDTYLEGLYGDTSEQLVSMLAIRHLSKYDECLMDMSENRLLICAMLRTLRDCRHLNVRESILYCLIRLTWYWDIYERLFEDKTSPIDIVKVVTDLLSDRNKTLQATAKQLPEDYFCINALLTIALNLLDLPRTQQTQLVAEQRLLSQADNAFVESLIELLQLISRYLSVAEVQLLSKPERPLRMLIFTLAVLRYLSVFKEFIVLIRKHKNLHDSLVHLLNVLQQSRSDFSIDLAEDQVMSSQNRQLLNNLYLVEMELLKLINNLLFERGLKQRLLKRNLLKCVLLNLVLYLAARKSSDSLAPYEKSSVLMVPMKALYELSCEFEVRKELSKSRIIMKCLLEFLLSSSRDFLLSVMDLEQSVESKFNSSAEEPTTDQVVLEPDCAGHFILSLWINLSAFEWPEALDKWLVCSYVDLSITLVRKVTFPQLQSSRTAHKLLVYLHLKLLRNLTQFWPTISEQQEEDQHRVVVAQTRWSHLLVELSDRLLLMLSESKSANEEQYNVMMATECLATLSNLIQRLQCSVSEVAASDDNCELQLETLKATGSLLGRLFQLGSASSLAATENDDLLLASVTFLGTLAQKCEICSLIRNDDNVNGKQQQQDEKEENQVSKGRGVKREGQQLEWPTRRWPMSCQIISASNFILSSRASDRQMIVCSLCTLGQLSKHLTFLNDVRAQQQELLVELEPLVDKLAALMLNGSIEQPLVELSVCLLSRLRQLELMVADSTAGETFPATTQQSAQPKKLTCDDDDDDEIRQLVYKKRFVGYNGKWLAAIRQSRRADDFPGTGKGVDVGDGSLVVDDMIDGVHSSLFVAKDRNFDYFSADNVDDYEDDDDDEDNDLDQVRAFEEANASGNANDLRAGESHLDDVDDEEEEEEEFGCDELEEDEEEAPDLNVIDANSMIKHLTSRKGFRVDWLSNVVGSAAATGAASRGTGKGG